MTNKAVDEIRWEVCIVDLSPLSRKSNVFRPLGLAVAFALASVCLNPFVVRPQNPAPTVKRETCPALTGIVIDPNRTPVMLETWATITNQATNVAREQKISSLDTGKYTVRVTTEGFPARDKNSLSFSLESGKATYQVAEPLVLTATLRNDGPTVAIDADALDVNYGSVAIIYRKTGSEFLRFIPIFNRDCLALSPPFQFSGEIKKQYSIVYQPGLSKYVLNESGEYEIQMIFFLSHTEKLFSNIVKIKVSEPPKEEKEALELLRDPMLAEFISSTDLFWNWL